MDVVILQQDSTVMIVGLINPTKESIVYYKNPRSRPLMIEDPCLAIISRQ